MRYNEFRKAVNQEFTRCAKYEPNVDLSIEDCAEISKYFTDLIWDFMAKQTGAVFYPEYLGATIYEAKDNFLKLDWEVYFDIGLENAFIIQCLYEDDVEYIFGIKEY